MPEPWELGLLMQAEAIQNKPAHDRVLQQRDDMEAGDALQQGVAAFAALGTPDALAFAAGLRDQPREVMTALAKQGVNLGTLYQMYQGSNKPKQQLMHDMAMEQYKASLRDPSMLAIGGGRVAVMDPGATDPRFFSGPGAGGDEDSGKLKDIMPARGQFRADSKDFITVLDAYSRMESIFKGDSPASDMAMIFSYMKMLDPGSTVREGEYASARNTTGIPGQLLNLYNQAREGQILNEVQRQDFMGRAAELFQPMLQKQKLLERESTDLATRYNKNPRDIVVDFIGKYRDWVPGDALNMSRAPEMQTHSIVPGSVRGMVGDEVVPNGRYRWNAETMTPEPIE